MRLDDLFIGAGETLVAALQRLDGTARGALLVVEDGDRLVGTLTDGDVRRRILGEGSLDSPIEGAYNASPVTLTLNERARADAVMRERRIGCVPILDGEGRVVDCAFRDGGALRRETRHEVDLPVVMMAGGLGTRLYPYTKVLPKPLIPVNDVPISERIINSFREWGCSEFYLVVNHKKEMIKAYYGSIERHYDVRFVEEPEFLGTGGGAKLVEGELASTFILTNCDILVRFDIAEALALHRERGDAVTVVASLKNYEIPYGNIEIDAGGSIARMTEKPTIPFLVNTGCYIVEPEALGQIGEGESVGFPDVVQRCKDAGMGVGVYPVSERSWLDMGVMEEWSRMSEVLKG